MGRLALTWKHIPLFLIIMILTFIIHEAGHFLMGKLLGYEMFVSINKAGITQRGTASADWHQTLMTLNGPIVTYAQAIIGLLIAHRYKTIRAFLIVFAAFTMRLMAAVISLFSPNDEYRVSEWLGLGAWTLPVIAVAGLLLLTLLTSRQLGLGWRSWLLAYLTSTLAITAVIFTERYWPVIVW